MANRPHYGIDAPPGVRMLVLLGTIGLVLLIARRHSALSTIGADVAIGCYAGAACMLLSSTLGKRIQRNRILDLISWNGNEQVLDIGCGRGLLLVGAAGRLGQGRAFGIDVWKEQDQSGNRPAATRLNAELDSVSDRVEVVTADARSLPFPNNRFDVILSSLCLHNIHGKKRRRKALEEIARVLRPGGTVLICDILHIGEYAQALRQAGLAEVHTSGPSFLYIPPVRRVTAKKQC